MYKTIDDIMSDKGIPQKDIIVKKIKKGNHAIGYLVAVNTKHLKKYHLLKYSIGWSLCQKNDSFNRKFGQGIALARALKSNYFHFELPKSIQENYLDFEIRCKKYFYK